MKAWLHWLVLHTVPEIYLAVWRRRKYFWLQVITDPTADTTALFDRWHKGPKLIEAVGLTLHPFLFLVGHHDTVTEALHNPALQSMSNRNQRLPSGVVRLEELLRPDSLQRHPLAPPGINAVEGADHARLRRAVSGWFTARRMADFSQEIERETKLLLDRMAEQRTVNLMEGYCRQLPTIMIGSVFGLSPEDVAKLNYLRPFDSAMTTIDVGLNWRVYKGNSDAIVRLFRWIEDQVRDSSRNGLPQALARDNSLNDEERIVTSALILAAGWVTTMHLLANGIRLLLDHPDQLAILRDHPELWPNAVEEILRMEAPLRCNARIAVQDTMLADQRIRKGQIVILYMAAANHDPAVFDDPHTFDVTRENAHKHLSFSAGRHYCIGPALSRAEALIALPMFFERFPHARIAQRPVRTRRQVMQEWGHLWVTLQ